ncbi:hypothetical protein [Pedobacter sp. FW305-3-2-15-E-R2A2]
MSRKNIVFRNPARPNVYLTRDRKWDMASTGKKQKLLRINPG